MKSLIPPVLVVLCLVGMTLIHFLASPEHILSYPYNLIGLPLIAVGILVGISVGRLFKRGHTEIHTFKEPKKLITSGLFRYSRNPIYVGFTILLIGFAICFGSPISFLFPFLFWIVANYWYIPFEERNMQRKFGASYADYRSSVRKWL